MRLLYCIANIRTIYYKKLKKKVHGQFKTTKAKLIQSE